MKKQYIIILVLVLLVIPIISFADDSAVQQVKYFKGNGAIEDWFVYAFKDLDITIGLEAFKISYIGRSIGALGCLMSLAYLGYQMQEGMAEWSVIPMIKPIIFGLILLNWGGFTDLIKVPLEKLADPSFDTFDKIEKEADDLRVKRYTMQKHILEQSIRIKAINDAKIKTIDNGDKNIGEEVLEYMGKEWDEMTSFAGEYVEKTNYYLQKLLADGLDTICLIILRVAVYFIFTIQKVWSYVLIVLGPIAVGIALIPGFESSFYNWVAKFININLYTFIGMQSINIGQKIIMAGYNFEINRYAQIVDENGNLISEKLLLEYNSMNGALGITAFTAVGYLITAAAILMTPTIADSIVSAGGAGIMTKMKSNAGRVASGAKAGAKGTIKGARKTFNGTKGALSGAMKGAKAGGIKGAIVGGVAGGIKGLKK